MVTYASPPAPSSRSRWAGLIVAVLAFGACIAPTLPIPPPSVPEVTAPDARGQTTVSGGKYAATANAEITVWNESYAHSAACKADKACAPGIVRLVDGDGSYTVVIRAQSKDLLFIWQTVGNQTSGQIETRVP